MNTQSLMLTFTYNPRLQYYHEFDMHFQKDVYTGEAKKGPVLQFGNYFISLKGKNHFDQFDTVNQIASGTGDRKLPPSHILREQHRLRKCHKAIQIHKGRCGKKAQEQLELLLENAA